MFVRSVLYRPDDGVVISEHPARRSRAMPNRRTRQDRWGQPAEATAHGRRPPPTSRPPAHDAPGGSPGAHGGFQEQTSISVRRPVIAATRRIFVDTEFTALPWTGTSELLWVGLADEDGRQWSAVCADADLTRISDFSRTRVIPLMTQDEPRLDRPRLRDELDRFCGPVDEFWAWFPSLDDLVRLGVEPAAAPEMLARYADWDYLLLIDLMGARASRWPAFCNDLHALARAAGITLPPNPRTHHPAYDAAWGRAVYEAAMAQRRGTFGRQGDEGLR